MMLYFKFTRRLRNQLVMCLMVAGFAFGAPVQAIAGEVKVLRVKASETSENLWKFSVTVRHKDKGWKHYADKWEVLSPEGDIIATRVLAHPHVDEQPFTRSLSGVKIPEGLTQVIIRAHDSIHGYGDKQMRVDLTTGKTTKFEYTAPADDDAETVDAYDDGY